jgi:hypothetical protein
VARARRPSRRRPRLPRVPPREGPEREDHVLYASHTVWRSREDFEAWTRSEAFRAAHRNAGDNKPLYLGHPVFEGFEILQTITAGAAARDQRGQAPPDEAVLAAHPT